MFKVFSFFSIIYIMKRQVFKNYEPNQLSLPLDLSILIPNNHIVKIVSDIIDSIDISPLLALYEGGGTSAYHPKMLLKVIIYAYTQKIYSGRAMEQQLKENIFFMWISGKNTPNFRTINRFRTEKMKDHVESIFTSVIKLLIEQEYIKFENYFLDGTKIEANANKYSFVWKKSTEKYEKALQDKIKKLLKDINLTVQEENSSSDDKDNDASKKISSEELKKAVEIIDKQLEQDTENKELKKAKKTIEKDYLPRTEKYEEYLAVLRDRNSFSKTDLDATFMKLKEDHMMNGQLKPAYNVQIGTENQFILWYTLHQTPGDTTTLKHHLSDLKNKYGFYPKNIVTDAGYGSVENYEILKEEELGNYVKYNNWFNDVKNKKVGKYWNKESFIYVKEKDEYICPNGERLVFKEVTEKATSTGFIQKLYKYQCVNCSGCEMRELCTKGNGNRSLEVNKLLEEHKRIVRRNLCSEEGTALRKQRCADVEATFGIIKGNGCFRRFLLRSLAKVKVEWGLIALAHNMKKLWALISKSAKELLKNVSFLIFCKTIRELLKRTIKHHYQKIKSDPKYSVAKLAFGSASLKIDSAR